MPQNLTRGRIFATILTALTAGTLGYILIGPLTRSGRPDTRSVAPSEYKDPVGGQAGPASTRITTQEVMNAVDALVQTLQQSEAFSSIPATPKPGLTITSIRNNTVTDFDLPLVKAKITASLIKTRRFAIPTSGDDNSESPAQTTDYALSGTIIEDRSGAGQSKQAAYLLQLRIIEVKTGACLWMGEQTITNGIPKAPVGF